MNKIIFDTSFIVGFIDEKDIWHKQASLINDKISANQFNEIVFDCVISEAISVIIRRQIERKEERRIEDLINKLLTHIHRENITWVYPEIERLYDGIIKIVKTTKGALNFNDALIVSVANEFEVPYIVSFDKGFDKTNLKRIKDARDI
ncbi:MAG: type II toxin-antitoxin system VapC family toxin [Nitrospirae bacterium]|nr:type II toxin-antitoxin system VapC family toxin [Nitrospirota bacterium]